MKSPLKKLVIAALIVGAALCGSAAMNRAEAGENITVLASAGDVADCAGDLGDLGILASSWQITQKAIAILNNTIFRDDEALDSEERSARQAGRIGSYAGAAVGTAAVYGVVATAGSAAGITSTLAAIGGTVGGSMIAGTAMVIAAPAAIAAGVGGACYGCYKLVTWLWG